MFNTKKTSDVNEIKASVNDLVEGAENTAADIANDVKNAANNLQTKSNEYFNESKSDVMELTHNLKALLTDVDYSGKAHEIKAQVLRKADEWRHLASDEVTKVLAAGTEKTRKTVREQPLLTLGVAAGAGLLIGYLLGQKKSSK